jgi:uncharacterized membrane protein
MSSSILPIIVVAAILTYLTRIGGHLVLSRFQRIHPRVQAGLDAVPTAVLTAIIAPYAMDAGPAELAALAVAALASLRLGTVTTIAIAAAVLIALRYLGY